MKLHSRDPAKILYTVQKKIGSSELNDLTVTHWSASSSQHSRSSPSSSIKQNIKKFSFFLNNHWMFYLFIWSFLIHQNDIHNLFHSKQKHANKKASYIFFCEFKRLICCKWRYYPPATLTFCTDTSNQIYDLAMKCRYTNTVYMV